MPKFLIYIKNIANDKLCYSTNVRKICLPDPCDRNNYIKRIEALRLIPTPP